MKTNKRSRHPRTNIHLNVFTQNNDLNTSDINLVRSATWGGEIAMLASYFTPGSLNGVPRAEYDDSTLRDGCGQIWACRNLIAAVIDRALRDAFDNTIMKKQRFKREAREWLYSGSTKEFSFHWYASMLGLTPQCILERMEQQYAA